MRIQIQQVSVPLTYEDDVILQRVSRKIGCHPCDLSHLQILRRSLDARPRNPEPVFVLSVAVDLNLTALPKEAHLPSIEILTPPPPPPRTPAPPTRRHACTLPAPGRPPPHCGGGWPSRPDGGVHAGDGRGPPPFD
jgi:hypothetical protein